MSASTVSPAVENVLSAVEACLDATSAEALARLRAPAELQARIEVLADKCTEGQLTEDEREEYETLVRLGNFVGILQARARRRIGAGAGRVIDAATREFVRRRAQDRCEYCGLPQAAEPFYTFHVEHIVARQHGGSDGAENLALACYHCNCRKGTNLSTIDSESGQAVPLFHPRLHRWADHFNQSGDLMAGRTAIGRATVTLLRMNAADRRRLRG